MLKPTQLNKNTWKDFWDDFLSHKTLTDWSVVMVIKNEYSADEKAQSVKCMHNTMTSLQILSTHIKSQAQ